jgi:trans-aconitate methyltransferase
MTAFFRIHDGLEREGPGDRDSLDRVLAAAGVPPDGAICDAGCGPGADVAGLLTHVPRGRVHAVDLHPPFVAAVRARFADDPRVTAEVADFTRLSGPFDLIWAAGSVYAAGITTALAAFRGALAPGGKVAFSHLCWRVDDRPAAAAAFWAEDFPGMDDLAGAQREIAAAGWRVIDEIWLSPAAWAAYYGPMEARLDALEPGAAPDLAEAIAMHRREIAVWREDGASFGYRMFLVAP